MIHLYEKVPKTEDCVYGIREITNENPFENGPCVVTLIAVADHLKEINGSLRLVANMVNPNIDTTVDPDRRILGLGYGKYDEKDCTLSQRYPYSEDLEEFINKYITPLLTKNGKKIDVYEAMKKVRNITFLTYCNGDTNYLRIENKMREVLTEYGYTKEELDLIMCQICIATITSHNMKLHDNKMVMFNFGDIYDKNYEDSFDLRCKISSNIPFDDDGIKFVNYGSYISCYAKGDDDHSLYKYMKYDKRFVSLISTVLNTSLDNAIVNKDSDVIIPITYEKVGSALEKVKQDFDEEFVRNRKH